MTNVIRLLSPAAHPNKFRAAASVNKSKIESRPVPAPLDLDKKQEEERSPDDKVNLLFGRYRLRLAREIMGMGIMEISHRYGVSPHTWRKYEDGARRLPNDKKKEIEEDVRSEVSCL
jgi:hypothetical protein